MYSRVAGGVSNAPEVNPTAITSTVWIAELIRAKQLESARDGIVANDVLVNPALMLVGVSAIRSGALISRFADNTTNTSRSSGDKFKSTLDCVKVLAALSVTPKSNAYNTGSLL